LSECKRIEEKDKNKGKMFITLCVVKNSTFQTIYENKREKNFFYDKDELAEIVQKIQQNKKN